MKQFDVAVVGGGPAGMMAAGTAARRGFSTALIERNPILGKKLLITGKGRCNVTNDCDVADLIKNVPVNGGFLYSSSAAFSPADTMAFFEERGVPLKTERGNRVFPRSDRSADIARALKSYVAEGGVQVIKERVKSLIIEEGILCGLSLWDGDRIMAPRVIVATGGMSYPMTGSTGDGYCLAREGGHTIIEPRPSLVPLNAKGDICGRLQGLSLKNVAITVKKGEAVIYRDFGELLFTHFGLSGPVILSASAHMRDSSGGNYRIVIDLKPALSEEKLDLRLLRDFEQNSRRDFANSLNGLLPQKLIPVIIELCAIDPAQKVNSITREQRRGLLSILKGLEIEIESARPIEEAIVTSGGVKTTEINPKTMESKLMPGLYFAGEIIDVDAYTGGFNLQIAFATAVAAARGLREY